MLGCVIGSIVLLVLSIMFWNKAEQQDNVGDFVIWMCLGELSLLSTSIFIGGIVIHYCN